MLKLDALSFVALGLQFVATVIVAYEKINNDMLKILLNNIKNIRAGNYVDESPFIEVDNNNNVGARSPPQAFAGSPSPPPHVTPLEMTTARPKEDEKTFLIPKT